MILVDQLLGIIYKSEVNPGLTPWKRDLDLEKLLASGEELL